jgi:riboflavin synthase
MFTGLIQEIGTVRANLPSGGYGRLEVAYAVEKGVLREGDSMAVNGVCLTATTVGDGVFTADVSDSTRKSSTVGELKQGSKVNLERPVTPSDPLGGHIVLGHVDCVGTIRRVSERPGGFQIVIGVPSEAADLLVDKGSVAVDGISLTVGAVTKDSFGIFIIPETRERTTLSGARPGTRVNIEVDYLAKLVRKFVEGKNRPPHGLSLFGKGED